MKIHIIPRDQQGHPSGGTKALITSPVQAAFATIVEGRTEWIMGQQ
jgi:hypothetical protein